MPRNRTDKKRIRTKQRKRTTNLGTWNVQSINKKINEVILEIKRLDIELAVITETKRKGQGSENLGEYDHFFSGVPKTSRASKGVSIIVHRKWRKYIKTWEAINERMIKINICMFGRKVTILGVYAVNDDEPVSVKETFFQQLNDEVLKIGTSRELIILGDLNSRTGRKQNDNIIGRHGEDTSNDNGERLITVCDQNNLRILNGFYQHREIHKYTWRQETRDLKSIIDYVIAKQKTGLKFQDVRVCRGATCGSDHYLLKTKIFFPGRYSSGQAANEEQDKQSEKLQQRRYNLHGLEDQSTRTLYQTRLNQKLKDKIFNSTEEHYNHIKECIHEAATEALGVYENNVKQYKPYWWDKEIKQEIEDKRRKYQQYLSSKNVEHKRLYKEAQANVRRRISQKKNETWERNCTNINTYLGGRRSTESWRILKNIRAERKREIISPITPERWQQYFKQLLTEQRQEFVENGQPSNIRTIGSPIRITLEELRKHCISLKNGKAPGPGEIYGELIKYGGDKLTKHLQKLFQSCINGQEIPKEWKTTYLSTIFKKGDRSECDNYRGIAVTSTISRLYGKVIKTRIENEYLQMEAEEQAGFRAGRSTIDHIFSITQVIEKKIEFNQELHLLFVDLKKAYDNVPLAKLWQALETTNINVELIKAVKELYKQSQTRIKMGDKLTQGFATSKGLKQGCCLSPTLFKIYLEHALKEWKKKCKNMGLPLNDNVLYTLCFADDQILVAQDYEDMNYMTRKLIEEYTKWGLEINLNKTEYMCIGGQQQNLHLENGQHIKQCEKYKYLGITLTNNGSLDDAIRERNTQGRKAITLLNGILWDKNISRENKIRIYNTIVKAIITYSSEVWPMKERTSKMLTATEMDFWRRSAGRSRMERVTNNRIREIMHVKHSIIDDIKNKQLIWFGHVQRMPETRIPKQISQWRPAGRRKRGRPRKSWQSGVDEEIRQRGLGNDLWKDRDQWRLGIGRRRTL